ncbi:MAG: hypothetical protein DWQ01_22135 [Planctomycetota bacterium]|nr:MAG: hypothetical protein DWQ01_22135 [Planctomycetota bacterium]
MQPDSASVSGASSRKFSASGAANRFRIAGRRPLAAAGEVSKTGKFRLSAWPSPALLMLAVLGACQQPGTAERQKLRQQAWEQRLAETEALSQSLQQSNEALRRENLQLQRELSRLRREDASVQVETVRQELAELQRLSEALQASNPGGIEALVGSQGPILRLDEGLLFASGSHQLSEQGQGLLQQLAGQLRDSFAGGDYRVQVLGHTDDQPVQRQAERYPKGNLQLSCARALEVADFLQRHGVPESWISVAGFGPWQPVASHGDEQGRKQNRRVEILVLPALD